MHRLPCLVLLLLFVAASKILFEDQPQAAGTKQSRWADMAVRPAYFV